MRIMKTSSGPGDIVSEAMKRLAWPAPGQPEASQSSDAPPLPVDGLRRRSPWALQVAKDTVFYQVVKPLIEKYRLKAGPKNGPSGDKRQLLVKIYETLHRAPHDPDSFDYLNALRTVYDTLRQLGEEEDATMVANAIDKIKKAGRQP